MQLSPDFARPSIHKKIKEVLNSGDGFKTKELQPGDKLHAFGTAAVTQTLSHEAGHATYPYKSDFSSKSAYVNGALADEGAATMNNIKVQREILANGGPDIGIAGNGANHPVYNKAYDQLLKDSNATAARQTIGQQFGNGEISSVKVGGKNLTYNEYYGSWYDKAYPPKK